MVIVYMCVYCRGRPMLRLSTTTLCPPCTTPVWGGTSPVYRNYSRPTLLSTPRTRSVHTHSSINPHVSSTVEVIMSLLYYYLLFFLTLPMIIDFQDGRTPLFVAARMGQTTTCKLLLEKEADINSTDGDNRYRKY